MTEPTHIRWDYFLIESWGGMMLTAKIEIVKRGLEFYLPLTWRRAKVDGRDRAHPENLMPGNYAFVRLARGFSSDRKDAAEDTAYINDQASALAQLRGVRAVFKNARGAYSPVPRREIQALKDREAQEHQEASRGKGKVQETRFKPGTKVRIVRHATAEGHVGEYLYSYHGSATLAMPGGVKFTIPECDLVEAPVQSTKMVG